jgi:hypothetical protein
MLDTVIRHVFGKPADTPGATDLRVRTRAMLSLAQRAVASGNWRTDGATDPDQPIFRLEAALAADTDDAELAPATLDLVELGLEAVSTGEWKIDGDALAAIFDLHAVATATTAGDEAPVPPAKAA